MKRYLHEPKETQVGGFVLELKQQMNFVQQSITSVLIRDITLAAVGLLRCKLDFKWKGLLLVRGITSWEKQDKKNIKRGDLISINMTACCANLTV